jgi:signal transduction histidine kinase
MDVEVRSFALDFEGRPSQLVAVLDVTERLRLETRLRHSQRLQAVGQLAGGIAHDFNNVLTAITNYASVLLADIPPTDSKHDDVREIMKAAARAAGLTRHLLAFSRRQVLRPHVFSPKALVGDLEKLLRRVLPEHVELVTAFGAEVGHVRADAGQLEQVLLNLVVNARDAMPEGGTVTITTRNASLLEPYATPHVVIPPGCYVALDVNDIGVGMDPETQQRIFEPFFTTKPPGMGTGLGLAVAHGIVTGQGGRIEVESEPGKGSCFTVHLPRVARGAARLTAVAA